MNPSQSDLTDHVLEKSPDGCWDVWDEAEDALQEGLVATVVLPARRTVNDPSPGRQSREVGFRIEAIPTPTRSDAPEAVMRLEVHQIGNSVVRLDPSEPAPAKVERQYTFHEKPAKEKRGESEDGEGREWGKVHRHPIRWMVGMGVSVTVLVVATLMLLPVINSTNAPANTLVEGTLREDDQEKIEGVDEVERLLTLQPEALQIFRAYAQASLIEEIVPLIKGGSAMEETLRNHWEPLRMPSSWAPAADAAWGIQTLSGRAYGILEGALPDEKNFAAYFTEVDGRLVMDWKATVAFGTAPFATLAEGRGDASEIRGEISPAEYYTAAWPEDQYRSFRLTSPDRQMSIWCYVHIGSTAEMELAPLVSPGEILEDSQISRKITLRLVRGAPESLPNQWLIGEMLQTDWVSPAKAP